MIEDREYLKRDLQPLSGTGGGAAAADALEP